MFEWLQNNWGTLLVAAIIVGIAAAIVVYLIRRKIRGETSCSCGCKGCSGACSCCHLATEAKKEDDTET